MSRIFTSFLISQVAIALGVAGCAFKEDTGPAKPEANPSDVIETMERGREAQAGNLEAALNDAKLAFDATDVPNSYIARLSWSPVLKRVIVSKKDDPRERVLNNSTEYSEPVRGGTTVSYLIQVQDSFGMSLFSRELVGEVPKDGVVVGTISLRNDEYWNYHRVFISGNGRIVLNGFNLSIRTQSLIIYGDGERKLEAQKGEAPTEYAHILTNEPHALVKNGRVGGSIINIQADRAEGNLIVHLMGAKGLPGKSGSQKIKEGNISLDTPKPEQKGAPGQPGRSRVRALPCKGMRGDVPCDSQIICEAAPTNGGAGQNGLPGPSGDRGESGAKTGSIYFDVKDHRDFTATVYFTKGPGGDGGEGSEVGYVGGLGGEPGAPANGCPSAIAGPRGSRGGKGQNGASGEEGEVGDMRGNGVNLIPIPYELPGNRN